MSSTTFPSAVQSFKQWENLTAEQLTAYVNYINALNRGEWATARKIFTDGNLSENMLPTAKDFNEMCDTILECKALYEAPTTSAQGIQDFMSQFAYRGGWDANRIAQYKKFTLIKYKDRLYMAVVDITSSNSPDVNTTQWVGIRPTSYTNTSTTYRGVWDENASYMRGDMVEYNNALYLAMVDNNNAPTSGGWYEYFDFNSRIAQLSQAQPTGQRPGMIWFKIL